MSLSWKKYYSPFAQEKANIASVGDCASGSDTACLRGLYAFLRGFQVPWMGLIPISGSGPCVLTCFKATLDSCGNSLFTMGLSKLRVALDHPLPRTILKTST